MNEVDQPHTANATLLPVGRISLSSNNNPIGTNSSITFNIAAYLQRRAAIHYAQNNVSESSPGPTTPALSIDLTPVLSSRTVQVVDSAVIDSFIPMSIFENDLANDSRSQAPASSDCTSAAPKIATTQQNEVHYEEWQPNTQVINEILRAVLGEDAFMEDVQQNDQQYTCERQSIPITPSNQSSTINNISTINQPTTMISSLSSLHQESNSPQEAIVPEMSATSRNRKSTEEEEDQYPWYASDSMVRPEEEEGEIISDSNIDNKKIYAYYELMVPIFPTLIQQRECDQVIKEAQQISAAANQLIRSNINTLNFPIINIDCQEEELWCQSGKTIFIKQLLENLPKEDFIILIVTKDMDEEKNLLDMIKLVVQI